MTVRLADSDPCDSESGLFLLRPGERPKFVNGGSEGADAAFSPDGRYFVHSTAGCNWVIATVSDPRHGRKLRIYRHGGRSVCIASARFSPDGARLVIDDEELNQPYIATVSVLGGQIRYLVRGSSPDWSVGNRIAFVRDDPRHDNSSRIWTIRPDGRDKRALTHRLIPGRPISHNTTADRAGHPTVAGSCLFATLSRCSATCRAPPVSVRVCRLGARMATTCVG